MSWNPLPLQSTGVVAIMPIIFVGRRPVSGLQLLVEAFGTSVAVIALFWPA